MIQFYGVTKTAQLLFVRCPRPAKYVAGSGVIVNSVLPGPTISTASGLPKMLKDEVAKPVSRWRGTGRVATHRPSSIQRAASRQRSPHGGLRLLAAGVATSGAALRVDGGVVDDIL